MERTRTGLPALRRAQRAVHRRRDLRCGHPCAQHHRGLHHGHRAAGGLHHRAEPDRRPGQRIPGRDARPLRHHRAKPGDQVLDGGRQEHAAAAHGWAHRLEPAALGRGVHRGVRGGLPPLQLPRTRPQGWSEAGGGRVRLHGAHRPAQRVPPPRHRRPVEAVHRAGTHGAQGHRHRSGVHRGHAARRHPADHLAGLRHRAVRQRGLPGHLQRDRHHRERAGAVRHHHRGLLLRPPGVARTRPAHARHPRCIATTHGAGHPGEDDEHAGPACDRVPAGHCRGHAHSAGQRLYRAAARGLLLVPDRTGHPRFRLPEHAGHLRAHPGEQQVPRLLRVHPDRGAERLRVARAGRRKPAGAHEQRQRPALLRPQPLRPLCERLRLLQGLLVGLRGHPAVRVLPVPGPRPGDRCQVADAHRPLAAFPAVEGGPAPRASLGRTRRLGLLQHQGAEHLHHQRPGRGIACALREGVQTLRRDPATALHRRGLRHRAVPGGTPDGIHCAGDHP